MSTLNFTLNVEGLTPETLIVREYQGQESLSDYGNCHGFKYQIELASRHTDITPDQIVDKNAWLSIIQNGEVTQIVHGIARAFFKGDTGHQHTFYSLTLVPSIERLSLRQNSRIFQNLSVPEILSVLFQEMGINDYTFSLKRSCQPREFCVQYRETDLEFLHRLAAEEGLVYRFTHEIGKHTIVFGDDSQTYDELNQAVTYNTSPGGHIDTPYVSRLYERSRSDVTNVTFQEYSFKKPAYSFKQEQLGQEIAYQRDGYEHYDAPTRYKDDESGKAFSKYRLEYLRRKSHIAYGQSNHARLQAGVKFTLTDHVDPKCNRSWLIISATHKGTQHQALEEEGGSGATTYNNEFTVIPSHKQWRATPLAKPQVDGPMIAKVVGPAGEEIFCDEHGRVKVHFPWDRESSQDEHSSCWVRVSQGWAGGQYGMIAIPRIGHEVIVSFLNGDPDQPIITGRTYHATNVTPYILPSHKTRTVLKTQTHLGEGFNELRFEDEASREQIYVHAQKDKDVVINNISRESIGLDFHQKVGQHYYQMVTENTHRLVGKNVTEEFGQDHHYKVGRNLVQRVIGAVNQFISGGMVTKIEGGSVTSMSASEEKEIGANQRIVVNNESYLNATNIMLEAKQELTIKGPGGFVKIDGGGITISGNVVKINEGGSPGSGTAPNIIEPELPTKPQEPDEPDRRA